MTENLEVYFNQFGSRAQHESVSGSRDIDVIFYTAYAATRAKLVSVENTSPLVRVRTDDAQQIQPDDTLWVGSDQYRVSGPPEHDGTGMSIIRLSESI